MDGGDCYVVAAQTAQECPLPEMLIVHGEIVSGALLGHIVIGHAWNEVGDVVFDYSNGNKVATRKEKYYAVHKPTNIRRYTVEQALELMLETEHYGPWIKNADGRWMTSEELDATHGTVPT